MTARDRIETGSNVISLNDYRQSITPTKLDEAGVAEFLQDEFDIDVNNLDGKDTIPHPEVLDLTSEADGNDNTDRIVGMATVVIDLAIDESEADEKPEPKVKTTSPWAEDIKIFLSALQEKAEQELATGCQNRPRGTVIPLFATNKKIKKDV